MKPGSIASRIRTDGGPVLRRSRVVWLDEDRPSHRFGRRSFPCDFFTVHELLIISRRRAGRAVFDNCRSYGMAVVSVDDALTRHDDRLACATAVACLAAESFHVKQPAVSHASSLFHVEHTERGFGPDALSRELVSRETGGSRVESRWLRARSAIHFASIYFDSDPRLSTLVHRPRSHSSGLMTSPLSSFG
jgi:hypothetical protein